MYVNIWLYNRMAFVPVTEVIPTGKRYEQIIGIIDALKKIPDLTTVIREY
jgi:hypothetical protein